MFCTKVEVQHERFGKGGKGSWHWNLVGDPGDEKGAHLPKFSGGQLREKKDGEKNSGMFIIPLVLQTTTIY